MRAWSDCGRDILLVFKAVTLVENLMGYCTTNTIAPSNRTYCEVIHSRPPMMPATVARVPTALAIRPHDLPLPPRETGERLYNVKRHTVFARGGHCPAWEAPDHYLENLKNFAVSFV